MKTSKQLLTVLSHLTLPQQGLFACLIVEKMKPSFDYFFSHEEDKIEATATILDTCFDYLIALRNSKINSLSHFLEQIEELTPNLDEEEGAASYAFDFCVACHALLQFLHDFEAQKLEAVMEQAIATVDMFIQEYLNLNPSDADLENKIAQDSFMLNEVDRQQKLLKAVQSINDITDEQVFQLRDMNRSFPNMINLKKLSF